MRFRHADPAPVLAFLEREAPRIVLREWERERAAGGIAGFLRITKAEPAAPSKPASVEDVAYLAGRGPDPSHVRAVLRFFFHVNSSAEQPILPLVEAVEHVETRGAEGEFLLAGHPDGGLISVSREKLPFQHGLEPVTWWGP